MPSRRVVDGDVLQLVDPGRVDQAEHAAHARFGVGVGHLAVREELHLLEASSSWSSA